MPPAARIGDAHICPITIPLPHVGGPVMGPPPIGLVLIGGLPAAMMGTTCTCMVGVDVIALGCPFVLVNFRPIAFMGSATAHAGMVTTGWPTVVVGDAVAGFASMLGAARMLVTGGGTKMVRNATAKSVARGIGRGLKSVLKETAMMPLHSADEMFEVLNSWKFLARTRGLGKGGKSGAAFTQVGMKKTLYADLGEAFRPSDLPGRLRRKLDFERRKIWPDIDDIYDEDLPPGVTPEMMGQLRTPKGSKGENPDFVDSPEFNPLFTLDDLDQLKPLAAANRKRLSERMSGFRGSVDSMPDAALEKLADKMRKSGVDLGDTPAEIRKSLDRASAKLERQMEHGEVDPGLLLSNETVADQDVLDILASNRPKSGGLADEAPVAEPPKTEWERGVAPTDREQTWAANRRESADAFRELEKRGEPEVPDLPSGTLADEGAGKAERPSSLRALAEEDGATKQLDEAELARQAEIKKAEADITNYEATIAQLEADLKLVPIEYVEKYGKAKNADAIRSNLKMWNEHLEGARRQLDPTRGKTGYEGSVVDDAVPTAVKTEPGGPTPSDKLVKDRGKPLPEWSGKLYDGDLKELFKGKEDLYRRNIAEGFYLDKSTTDGLENAANVDALGNIGGTMFLLPQTKMGREALEALGKAEKRVELRATQGPSRVVWEKDSGGTLHPIIEYNQTDPGTFAALVKEATAKKPMTSAEKAALQEQGRAQFKEFDSKLLSDFKKAKAEKEKWAASEDKYEALKRKAAANGDTVKAKYYGMREGQAARKADAADKIMDAKKAFVDSKDMQPMLSYSKEEIVDIFGSEFRKNASLDDTIGKLNKHQGPGAPPKPADPPNAWEKGAAHTDQERAWAKSRQDAMGAFRDIERQADEPRPTNLRALAEEDGRGGLDKAPPNGASPVEARLKKLDEDEAMSVVAYWEKYQRPKPDEKTFARERKALTKKLDDQPAEPGPAPDVPDGPGSGSTLDESGGEGRQGGKTGYEGDGSGVSDLPEPTPSPVPKPTASPIAKQVDDLDKQGDAILQAIISRETNFANGIDRIKGGSEALWEVVEQMRKSGVKGKKLADFKSNPNVSKLIDGLQQTRKNLAEQAKAQNEAVARAQALKSQVDEMRTSLRALPADQQDALQLERLDGLSKDLGRSGETNPQFVLDRFDVTEKTSIEDLQKNVVMPNYWTQRKKWEDEVAAGKEPKRTGRDPTFDSGQKYLQDLGDERFAPKGAKKVLKDMRKKMKSLKKAEKKTGLKGGDSALPSKSGAEADKALRPKAAEEGRVGGRTGYEGTTPAKAPAAPTATLDKDMQWEFRDFGELKFEKLGKTNFHLQENFHWAATRGKVQLNKLLVEMKRAGGETVVNKLLSKKVYFRETYGESRLVYETLPSGERVPVVYLSDTVRGNDAEVLTAAAFGEKGPGPLDKLKAKSMSRKLEAKYTKLKGLTAEKKAGYIAKFKGQVTGADAEFLRPLATDPPNVVALKQEILNFQKNLKIQSGSLGEQQKSVERLKRSIERGGFGPEQTKKNMDQLIMRENDLSSLEQSQAGSLQHLAELTKQLKALLKP